MERGLSKWHLFLYFNIFMPKKAMFVTEISTEVLKCYTYNGYYPLLGEVNNHRLFCFHNKNESKTKEGGKKLSEEDSMATSFSLN